MLFVNNAWDCKEFVDDMLTPKFQKTFEQLYDFYCLISSHLLLFPMIGFVVSFVNARLVWGLGGNMTVSW